MSYITGYDNRTVEAKSGADRIFGELCENLRHRAVKINLHGIPFSGIAKLLRNQFIRLIIHLLNPDTVGIDLGFDVSVCRAADSQTNRATGTMARKPDDTDIMSEIFSSELGTKANLMCLFQKLLLQLHVAERPSGLISGSRQFIIIMGGSKFHGKKVLLGRSTAHHDCNMVRRAGCRT